MANLAEAVDATETDWIISAELSDAIDYLTVESEIVKVTANFPAQRDPQTRIMQVPRIRVERGAGGTTAVSHADETALTPLIPPASSGGGAGVPDPTGAPDGQTIVTVAEEYELAASAGDLLVVERTLTAAEIHTLNSVPVVLVEGAPNTAILPAGGWVVFHAGPSPYVNPGECFVGTSLLIAQAQQWLEEEGLAGTVLNQVVSMIVPFEPRPTAGLRELSWVEGEDLIIQMDGADPDPAPDGDGTLDVVVVYRIVAV